MITKASDEITIKITASELVILNELIKSSTPNIKFGTVVDFVNKIQNQIKQQLNGDS